MTAPRPMIPGTFTFITRRCTQRQFLLRPDEEANNAFVYCLAEAANRFDVKVILSQMMSNHHHTATYDAHGHDAEFREQFHKMVAKSVNALRGRWENLWSTEETCVVEVISAADLIEKLVYIATNPVKDGLVDRVDHWPGPNFVKGLLTGVAMRATRPRHFFREDGTMPAEVELALGLPDHFEGKAQFLEELRRRITEVESAYARTRQQTGRSVVGRQRIRRQSWRESPTSYEPRRGLRPRVAARSTWARIAALQRNKEWQADYRAALKALQAGLPAEFPYGTYRLRRLANVVVRSRPAVPLETFTAS